MCICYATFIQEEVSQEGVWTTHAAAAVAGAASSSGGAPPTARTALMAATARPGESAPPVPILYIGRSPVGHQFVDARNQQLYYVTDNSAVFAPAAAKVQAP